MRPPGVAYQPEDIIQSLTQRQQDIRTYIERKRLTRTPVLDLIPTEVRENGLSSNLITRRFESNLLPQSLIKLKPVVAAPWGQVSQANKRQTGPVMSFGETEENIEGFEFFCESQLFNAEDFRYADNYDAKMANMMEVLDETVTQNRSYINRLLIRQNSGNKTVATGNLETSHSLAGPNDWPTDANGAPIVPSSTLTQDMLDVIGQRLERDGAGVGAYGRKENYSIFPLVVDPRTANGVMKNMPEIRADIRYASPDLLLKPYGELRQFFNFVHVQDWFRERFYLAGTPVPIQSLVVNGTTARVTVPAHGLQTGDYVCLEGNQNPADVYVDTLNDSFRVTKIDNDHFDIPACFEPSAPTVLGAVRKLGNVTGPGFKWVEVDPFVYTPTTYGLKRDDNLFYEQAPFEATSIYNKLGFKFLLPEQPPTPKGVKIEPQKYLGELSLRRPGVEVDKLQTQFFWISRILFYVERVRPEWLYSIIHRRNTDAETSGGF